MELSRRDKMLKVGGKEDRISALPDSLNHHILSFLPCTKTSIQTGILSKRWQNQWTRVPVLIFDYDPRKFNSVDIARFIDNTLLQYDCLKIKKLQLGYDFEKDSNFSFKIRFAMTRHVEELILNCLNCLNCLDYYHGYLLPKFLFDSSSLVKLKMINCIFLGDRIINWASLKAFEMDDCAGKSCLLTNVVSNCLCLSSLVLKTCYFDNKLVIASTSLKKLVLRKMAPRCAIEISCPNLEELDIYGFNYETFKLINSPSLICANLDFELSHRRCLGDISKQIFEQLQNVEKLTMGGWFIEMLSKVEMGGLSYSWSNNKTLTLNGPYFGHLPGIMCALRSSPVLERLVITLEVYEGGLTSYSLGENYWNSNGMVASCVVSHLKTVEIIGLSQRDAQREIVLGFIKFLVKNASVLEKLVLVIKEEYRRTTDFAFEVSQKVSRIPRHSRHAIVELLCSQ